MEVREQLSALALPQMIREGLKFQLIYIDGSHRFEDVFMRLLLCALSGGRRRLRHVRRQFRLGGCESCKVRSQVSWNSLNQSPSLTTAGRQQFSDSNTRSLKRFTRVNWLSFGRSRVEIALATENCRVSNLLLSLCETSIVRPKWICCHTRRASTTPVQMLCAESPVVLDQGCGPSANLFPLPNGKAQERCEEAGDPSPGF